MYIACNDTSFIVINFRKSKTHTIKDTYCTSILRGYAHDVICAHLSALSLYVADLIYIHFCILLRLLGDRWWLKEV